MVKIDDVTVTLFRWNFAPWKTGVGTAFGGHKLLGVLTVRTDEGVEGSRFSGVVAAGADAYAGPLMEIVKPNLLGRNPLDIGAIWREMWKENRSVSTNAIGAVDVALWDIAGKVAGLPVHRLLGTCRDSVPAYSSTAWHATSEEYAEEALSFQDMGWTAHKIHPHGDPKSDIEICDRVRQAVGDDMILMLDSMWAYNYEDALRVGRAIEELGYYWYEDPPGGGGHLQLREAQEQAGHPDHVHGVRAGAAVRHGAVDSELRDGHPAGRRGGDGRDHAAGEDSAPGGGVGMKCEIHHGGNSLNNVANLHVTMAVPNCEFYEVFPATGANKYALVEDIEVDGDGLVYAPTEPAGVRDRLGAGGAGARGGGG